MAHDKPCLVLHVSYLFAGWYPRSTGPEERILRSILLDFRPDLGLEIHILRTLLLNDVCILHGFLEGMSKLETLQTLFVVNVNEVAG